jgi:hypothetical protein
MKPYMDIMKKENCSQLLLLIVLVLYIVFNINTPSSIAPYIDNIYSNVIIIVLAFFTLMHVNPILGIIALFAAYELIRRSADTNGTTTIKKFLPSQSKTNQHLNAFNQFPITLEEQMVKKMAPLVQSSGPSQLDYKPLADNTHQAMNVGNETSVI